MIVTIRIRRICTLALLNSVLLTTGCARKHMQASAARVKDSVDELRADVEVQQLIRTEFARTGAAQISRSEAELAAQEAARAALRPQLREAAEPLLTHSKAVSEGADDRFTPSIAVEVERRAVKVDYRDAVGELEALAGLLERLIEGSRRADIGLYIELGAAAADAAKYAWTDANAKD